MLIIKPVKNYPHYYITSDAEVWSTKSSKGDSFRVLRPGRTQGYWSVSLTNTEGKCSHHIHRLLASAFLHKIDNTTEVNHINGIRGDDRIENLEWVSRAQNTQHAYDNNLNANKGVSHYRAKLTETQVLEIRRLYKDGNKPKDLALKFEVGRTTIKAIIYRYNWKHI